MDDEATTRAFSRYLNDAEFHALVEAVVEVASSLDDGFSEHERRIARSAAVLAADAATRETSPIQ